MPAFPTGRDSAEFQRIVRPTLLIHSANKMPMPGRLVRARVSGINSAHQKTHLPCREQSIGGVKISERGKREGWENRRADRTDGPGSRGNWTFCQETTERVLREW